MPSSRIRSITRGTILALIALSGALSWSAAGVQLVRAIGQPQSATLPDAFPGMHPAAEEGTGTAVELPLASQQSVPDAASFPTVAKGTVPDRPDPHIALFLTATSGANGEFLAETMERLQPVEWRAIVVDVKGSAVYFDASSPMARELRLVKPLLGDLASFVAQAHAQGVYTIARFIAVKDPGLARRESQVQIRHPRTQRSVGDTWVDPAHPVSLAYNAEILRDIVRAGFDEINLDYIRYPTEYSKEEVGLAWQEKADRLEAFLRMAREVIDDEGKGTKLGMSTYAILGWNYEGNLVHLGQDVKRFAPLVDVISPMAYPSTFAEGAYYQKGVHPGSRMYYLVYRTLTGYRDLLGDEEARKVRPWIQGYFVSEQNMRDQMQAVADAGLCGFTVWNARNEYGPVFNALKDWETPAGCV